MLESSSSSSNIIYNFCAFIFDDEVDFVVDDLFVVFFSSADFALSLLSTASGFSS